MNTYQSPEGEVYVRSCANCRFFVAHDDRRTGYCQRQKMLFAYTMKATVYAMVKQFYLCDQHIFTDEEKFKETCRVITMEEAIRKKAKN